jgi:hypothetical protein
MKMTQLQHKDGTFRGELGPSCEVKELGTDGEFEGYASVFGEVDQAIKITRTRLQLLEGSDFLFDDIRAVDRLPRRVRVIPKAGGTHAVLQHCQLVF